MMSVACQPSGTGPPEAAQPVPGPQDSRPNTAAGDNEPPRPLGPLVRAWRWLTNACTNCYTLAGDAGHSPAKGRLVVWPGNATDSEVEALGAMARKMDKQVRGRRLNMDAEGWLTPGPSVMTSTCSLIFLLYSVCIFGGVRQCHGWPQQLRQWQAGVAAWRCSAAGQSIGHCVHAVMMQHAWLPPTHTSRSPF